MAELPKSWGLKTKKNAKGTLDIIGQDDAGKDYRVRTTDTPGITDRDVSELRDADRESYPDRERGVREFVRKLSGPPEDKSIAGQLEAAAKFDDSDWIAAAEPIVHAGFERKGLTTGSTRAFRRGWERMMKEN